MVQADKIVSVNEGAALVAKWKLEGEVVFTNGCFDILHLGHIDYLEKSRRLGSKLVVGLNTDASVKRLKGPERPLNNEYARARMLAALACTDAVILFDEPTPLELITAISPDVLVKGSDYTIDKIVGADFVMEHGGSVKTIDLVEGYSTTGIIEKIKTSLNQ
ncbi:D-glycero-beta-D-manno-heptose 1-phosphate adenylyltransferase [uncultured Cytophaga sp.]|uniref:D-glycero-beta-D-manno-heptose 1-phosphate adenylyltransferase n=1 Tax=uncultured Cytophaga sp. TaxID=160238 RepID=UPI002606A3D8|nr:D-glycero-beta-D-manno-heptose 1-phosphate adenylyltransferase [uncultured Cytophaga sp.]